MSIRIPAFRHLSLVTLAFALSTLAASINSTAFAAEKRQHGKPTLIALTAQAGKQSGKQTPLRITAAAYPTASCSTADAATALKRRPLQVKVNELKTPNDRLRQIKLAYAKLRSTAPRSISLAANNPLLAKPTFRGPIVRATVGPEEPVMVITVAAYAEAFAGAEATGYAVGFASGVLTGAGVVIVGGLIVYGAYWCYENYGGEEESGSTEAGPGSDTPPATPGGTPTPTATSTPTNPTDASVPGAAAFGH